MKKTSKNGDDLKNEDDHKNEDDLKKADDLYIPGIFSPHAAYSALRHFSILSDKNTFQGTLGSQEPTPIGQSPDLVHHWTLQGPKIVPHDILRI